MPPPQRRRKYHHATPTGVLVLSAAAAMLLGRSGGLRAAQAFSAPAIRGATARPPLPRRAPAALLRAAASSPTDAAAVVAPAGTHARLSRASLPSSLDARAVAEHVDVVLSHLTSRRAPEETLAAARTIAALNSDRVALIKRRDVALQRRNECSAQVGKLMRETKGEETEEIRSLKEEASQAGEEAAAAEEALTAIEAQVNALLASLPNLLDDNVPDGDDEGANELVHEWGDAQSLPNELGWPADFAPLWHDDVASNLGGWRAEAAVGMSGARFVALTGVVARLERALSSYFLDRACEKGYTEVSPPLVVSRSALEGTSQLPKFEEDLFKISSAAHTCNGEDAFLIPTAEVPLTNLHAGQILEEAALPISYCAVTPCFRAEAGSYGRDTRGLIRTHQFYKVELVKIATPAASDAAHHALTRHAEELLEELRLPYRRMRLCSGDVGFSAQHCYDLEAWLPSTREYREISSCSNTGDFQARRMALRYRPAAPAAEGGAAAAPPKGGKKKKAKKPKPVLCHTINGSGLAVGRTLVAVLENYQTPEGDVVVPEVLRPYMGGLEILKKQ